MTHTKLFCKIIVYVTPELHKKIKEICYDHEIPISFWIRELLEDEVKKEKQIMGSHAGPKN